MSASGRRSMWVGCTLHTSHYTLHIATYTLHTIHCTLHTACCNLHTAHCKLHTTHCILDTAYCSLHTAYCNLHTAHCTLHTTHCTLHTVHCTLQIKRGGGVTFIPQVLRKYIYCLKVAIQLPHFGLKSRGGEGVGDWVIIVRLKYWRLSYSFERKN